MFSMSASLILVLTAIAHTPSWQIPTHAYVQAVPNPVGVGQTAIVYMWIDQVMDGAVLGNDARFHNYKLVITAPDGTQTTKTFATVQDPTSNQGYSFAPTQVGTYTFDFTFPGEVYTYQGVVFSFTGGFGPSVFLNDTYLPSSASATLAVQETPPDTAPTVPLPTAYWIRPIYGENPNWYTISSNWLGTSAPGYGGAFPGDAVGPLTGHVMWTKPIQSGGVVGGDNFVIAGDTFFEGSAYNNRFNNPIIIDGKIYYKEPISFAGSDWGPLNCVDLRTGQLIWSRTDIPSLSFGYIYDVQDPNQHGVYPPILIAGAVGFFFGPPQPVTWRAFDAYTGNPLFNITDVPPGASAMGVNGEYLMYIFANDGTPASPQWYLGQWNSSKLWESQYSGSSTSPQVVPPITNGSDPSLYDWRVSIPSLNTQPSAAAIVYASTGNILLCRIGAYPAANSAFGLPSWSPYTYFAVNLNTTKGAIGSILWTQTIQPPAGNLTVTLTGVDPTANGGTGIFVENHKETMQFVGYSLTTGQKVWGPVGDQVAFNFYSTGYYTGGVGGCAIAYGKLYSGGLGGIIYCYDLTNGNLLWTYGNGGEGNSTSSGVTYPGPYPTSIYAVGNGVVYTITTQHQVETPIYKGALTRGINATDGTEIWTLSAYTSTGFTSACAIADGFATFFNGYDNQIYVAGRGPSATTVSAPDTAVSFGTPIVIKGSVMDVAAGTKQTQQTANFPNGVPCSSDSIMKDWMGYVYQQKPLPTNFVGVEVEIDVIDSNNNYRTIGSATTDAKGMFSYTWTPDIPGDFKVIVTFAGTNGYWPSSSETVFNVMSTPEPTVAPTAAPASLADQYLLPATGGIIAAIAVVGAILVLMLRKK